MATKTKSVRKPMKKTSAKASATEFQPLAARPSRFDSSIMLRNKKLSVGLVTVIIVLIFLAFAFKSVFIAAMVNGEPITRLSVVSALEKQGGKTTLENLITKKLILQEAKKRNINVTQSEIDAQIQKISANLQNQRTTLDQALAAQGMTKADLNDELKIQVALNKMVGDVTLTTKEIDDFVAANKAQMTPGTTEEQFRQEAITQLKQQKTQTNTQSFIKSLQDKAKIVHFVSY